MYQPIDFTEVISRIDAGAATYQAMVTKTDRAGGFAWKQRQERRRDLIRLAIEQGMIGSMDEEAYMCFIRDLMLQAGAIAKIESFRACTKDIRSFAASKWKFDYTWYRKVYCRASAGGMRPTGGRTRVGDDPARSSAILAADPVERVPRCASADGTQPELSQSPTERVMSEVSRSNIDRFSTISRRVLELPQLYAILTDIFGSTCTWKEAEQRFVATAFKKNKYGLMHHIYLRPDGHLSLQDETENQPAPDGIWLSESGDTGCYCVDGVGMGYHLSGGGKTYTNLRCYDGYHATREDARTVPYRRQRGFDCNLKRWKIEEPTLLAQGLPPLVIGIIQSVHRGVYAHEGDKVYHTEYGIIAHGARHKKEGALLAFVRDIFQNEQVFHKYRGRELEGLELDIYVVEHRIAFEYQGYQHYHPVERWGGDEQLVRQKKRDTHMREICARNKFTLIEVRYDEALNRELVERKLREAGCPPTYCP